MKSNKLLKSWCALLAAATMGWNVSAGTAAVSIGAVASHEPWDGQFDVSYTLAGTDPATDYKVAFDLTAGGKTAGVTNAAARLADGAYGKTIDTAALFGKATTDAKATVRVSLIAVKPQGTTVPDATGTPVGALGDVMIVDVSGGPTAATYPVTYVTGADIGTFNCDVYKTTKIVLRKVSAGTAYPAKLGATNALEVADAVTPKKDYYIGVFPVTAAQYGRVMDVASASQAPVTSVSWNALRGGVATATAITSASAAGFFQKLCAKCRDTDGALAGFDLPTEAQWDIAARAGSKAYYGSYLKNRLEVEGSAAAADEFAVCGSFAEAQAVGTKCPNAWGLFDTAGNVWEWCRDEYVAKGAWTDAETPKTDDESLKVVRGGCYNDPAAAARLTNRNNAGPGDFSANPRSGFRLSRTCP